MRQKDYSLRGRMRRARRSGNEKWRMVEGVGVRVEEEVGKNR